MIMPDGTDKDFIGLDRHFARFICRLAGTDDPVLCQTSARLARAVGAGDVCLDLAGPDSEGEDLPSTELLERLRGFSVIGAPGAATPLVLDDAGRLYLYRYWCYESDLARALLDKAAATDQPDEGGVGEWLARLFPAAPGAETDRQREAAEVAARRRLCVISGGPGTGKTSTVVKIIALLLGLAKGKKLRIGLAAPTGKAAARLRESIRGAKENLNLPDELKAMIPEDVVTLHRMLGWIKGGARFRHDADNPLPYDVLVVDEASMVAMPLMAKLAAALRRESRLILLGDRDQLASVEAGAVLGDICEAGSMAPEPGPAGTGIAGSMVFLERNYRFGTDSGIGLISRLVNTGQGGAALDAMGSGGSVSWQDAPAPDRLEKALKNVVLEGFSAYLGAQDPVEALRCLDDFCILCALRQGPYGVTGINGLVERILASAGRISPRSQWYSGRPIIVTANDYGLRLFNGDIGLILPDREGGGALRAFFPSPDGGVRKIAPVRLPAHETAFAMTVHKSQGSEFARILLLLPPQDSPVATRELVYTGITRARQEVMIWGGESAFVDAVSRRVQRKSGLRQALLAGATG